MLVKKFFSGILAVVMMGTMMIGSVPTGNSNNICASTVITASAASSDYTPGKRSGSHGVYVSKFWVVSNSITFKMNSDDDIDAFCQYCKQMELGIGLKPASYLTSLGNGILKKFGYKSPLGIFTSLFSGVGNYAGQCREARVKLTELSEKYKTRGFKVTLFLGIHKGGNILIELQPADEKLDAAYKRYIKAIEDEKVKKSEKEKKKPNYYKAYKGSSCSLVDSLKSVGVKNVNLSFRKNIYNANNLKSKYGEYVGGGKQNTEMLKLLKKGKLIKP